jgi:anti-sigma factor RsiW
VKSNLTCDACEREILSYADGTLHPAVARVMELHFEGCARCSASLAWHRTIAARIAELPGIPVPAGLEDRVLRAVTGPERAKARWARAGAAALALSFAATVGGAAFWPRLAKEWGLPDPGSLLAGGLASGLDAMIEIPKRIATDITFYEPIARQVFRSVEGLAALPHALLVSLRAPEAQAAGLVLLTLGVALYRMLRPAQRKEGGIGHACLAL